MDNEFFMEKYPTAIAEDQLSFQPRQFSRSTVGSGDEITVQIATAQYATSVGRLPECESQKLKMACQSASANRLACVAASLGNELYPPSGTICLTGQIG